MPTPSPDRVDQIRWELLDKLPAGSVFKFRVVGGSMRPLVASGAIAHVQKTGLDACCVGDLVLWHNQGRWILHRLMRKLPGKDTLWMQTKGDAQVQLDAPVSARALVGRTVAMTVHGVELRTDSGPFRRISASVGMISERAPRILWGLAVLSSAASKAGRGLTILGAPLLVFANGFGLARMRNHDGN